MNKVINQIIKEIKTEIEEHKKPILYYTNLDKNTLETLKQNLDYTINEYLPDSVVLRPISKHYQDLITNLDRKVGIIKKVLKKYDLNYKFVFLIQESSDFYDIIEEYVENKYFPNIHPSIVCNALELKISKLLFETNSIFPLCGLLSQKSNRQNLKHIEVE